MNARDLNNAALIERFYNALSRRDAAAMIACYHRDSTFSDPVFPSLDAAGAAAMWRMLCTRGKDLAVTARDVDADASRGRAHWTARYTYSATGRPVVNEIDAEFEFRDGLIHRHRDRFDLHRWLAQALGMKADYWGPCRPCSARRARKPRVRLPTGGRAKRDVRSSGTAAGGAARRPAFHST